MKTQDIWDNLIARGWYKSDLIDEWTKCYLYQPSEEKPISSHEISTPVLLELARQDDNLRVMGGEKIGIPGFHISVFVQRNEEK